MLHLDTKENVEYEDWINRKNYVVSLQNIQDNQEKFVKS